MLEAIGGLPSFFLDYVVNIIFALAALFILPRVYKWFKISEDDKRRKLIEDALQNGIKWAIAQAVARSRKPIPGGSGEPTIGVSSIMTVAREAITNPDPLVADAMVYVKTGVGDTLAKLKVDDETLRQRVEARLPTVLQEPARGGNLL